MRHSNVQMKMSREKGVDVVVVVRAQHSTSHVTWFIDRIENQHKYFWTGKKSLRANGVSLILSPWCFSSRARMSASLSRSFNLVIVEFHRSKNKIKWNHGTECFYQGRAPSPHMSTKCYSKSSLVWRFYLRASGQCCVYEKKLQQYFHSCQSQAQQQK